jgi:CelD/BcsL family acetyltransferase involved in cellulose biosynthesis
MNVTLVPGNRLTADQAAAWSRIQQAEPSLGSPYFRPEFTQAVAAVRDDVETAILEEGGTAIGFFPFQRGRGNVARPVGGRLSDFQGVVIGSQSPWDPRQLLRQCGLAAWHFDHAIASQQPLRPYLRTTASSPYLDLSAGWEGYVAARRARHKETFRTLLRKLRHADREAGPLRIEFHSLDRDHFNTMLQWKRQQYRRTGALDVLAARWSVALLERIWQASAPEFSGVLTTLHLGDRLGALMLSMRSGEVLHAWFPAYDTELAHYSPGLMLFLELARIAESHGIRHINLGKGPEAYKEHLCSGAIELAEGSVDLRPLAGLLRRQWQRAYEAVRASPLRRPLRAPVRLVRRLLESRT